VVIDDRVDVIEPDLGEPTQTGSPNDTAAMGPPPAAIGDPSDLLDVHVQKLTWPGLLVADGRVLRCPDHVTGHGVTDRQERHVVTSEDPSHGPGRHAQLGTQPVRATAMLGAGGDHPRFDLGRCLRRHRVRPRRPVLEAGDALGVEAGNPAMGTLARHTHRPSDMSDGHVQLPHPLHEQTPTKERQTSVTVTHEDLRGL
jgi:hypothetical protein